MNSLLVHGVYDLQTLGTLKNLGIKEISFDLRGRSSNLVTFKDLHSLLSKLKTEKIFLTFENDRKETVLSFLNLLKDESVDLTLIFRDKLDPRFYNEINANFYWMFQPDADWKTILSLNNVKGVLLPLKFQNHYQKIPDLWKLIDAKNLDVYLHADTFEETQFMDVSSEIKLSIDLSSEVEKSYRTVDQDRLMKMKIWRRLHESSAGQ